MKPRFFEGSLRYLLLGVLLLAGITLSLAPFARTIIEQWTRSDFEQRSRLAFNSIREPVAGALRDGDPARLGAILQGVAKDDRILGVALCGRQGTLRAVTNDMPASFTCSGIAQLDAETFTIVSNEGQQVLMGVLPLESEGETMHLAILHDLTYTAKLAGKSTIHIIAALIGLVIILAVVAAMFGAFFARTRIRALRKAIEEFNADGPNEGGLRDRSAIDQEIKKLLESLETVKAPTEAVYTQWSPETLHDLLANALPGAEVFIISNREPYIHNRRIDGSIVLQRPASGLVSALEPVMRACGGTWIAHGSGTADREMVDAFDRVDVPPDNPAYKLRRVWVTDEEQDGYYYGFANEVLWPLCHIAFVRPIFRESDWHYYGQINERFAEAVAQEARTEDPIVLVQDYHLGLAPRMIRERLPKATIITFWHIPWPNSETFGICPWKERILEGLLGSSILGFHTQFHCNNFFETVDRFIESRIDREHGTVTLGGYETLIRPYPISIEWPPKALEGQASVPDCRLAVRERFGLAEDARLAVGIERLDYTKGILDRMHAIDILLDQQDEWKGRLTFIQVAAPSRSKLASYDSLQKEAVALAKEINLKHGSDGYQPVRLVIQHHEPHEVFELFRAADLCIVSSLHDGMNLVAKEFVASRDDDQGVLILSSFTGASREMSEALQVNPYDGSGMAQAIDAALRMPEAEQRERMRLMRQQVREQNVYRWAGRMLVDAAHIRQRRHILELARESAA